MPAVAASPSACDRDRFRTIIDVGHTADEPGAISARGVPEFDFNLRLARRIERTLVENGFGRSALLVRTGPNRAALAERVAAANDLRGDLLLSIHHDSVPVFLLDQWEFEGAERNFNDSFPGHSIFISASNARYGSSLAFARQLGLALRERGLEFTPHYGESFMQHRRRLLIDLEAGVYRFDRLYVLQATKMPAVLLEAGSIINRDEELVMQTPERQAAIADAVTEAVEAFCVSRRRVRSSRRAAP